MYSLKSPKTARSEFLSILRRCPNVAFTTRTNSPSGAKADLNGGSAVNMPKRYTASDGTLLLNLETEGKWFIVTSPLDPELVTQARSIEEAFRMAYDAKALLEEYRAKLAEKARSAKPGHTP